MSAITLFLVAGYVFSASLPPMLASAATRALELIDSDVTITSRLKAVSEKLHDALADMGGYVGALEPHGSP